MFNQVTDTLRRSKDCNTSVPPTAVEFKSATYWLTTSFDILFAFGLHLLH